MLANFLIGLREGLEMALIVSILVAYIVHTHRRDVLPRLWLGVAIALIVPLGIGALLTWGPYGLTFQAQEFLGGSLSLVAVGFVTGMVFWMSSNARTLKADVESRLAIVLSGTGWGVVGLAMLSVGREGIETALFVWAATASVGGGWTPIIGALLGILTAGALGILLYRGMIRMNLGTFFRWTGAFLIVVAAGVLSYGVGDLQEAGFLPGGEWHAFDISDVISSSSWYGATLMGVINFTPNPTWLQVGAWASYLLAVGALYLRHNRSGSHQAHPSPTTTHDTPSRPTSESSPTS